MQLTQFTDYSLRALIFIGVSQPNPTTIPEIAQAYGISQHHLTKIIHHLSKKGIITTKRGRNGGIVLAVPPASLNLKALVLDLEPHFDIVPCFNKLKQNCCIAPACRLKTILWQANQAFLDLLAQYTLADILQNPDDLKKLLHV